MPRRKAKGKTVDASGVELRPVRLELTPDAHYKLRQAAAKHEMSMANYARLLVETALGMRKKAKREEVAPK